MSKFKIKKLSIHKKYKGLLKHVLIFSFSVLCAFIAVYVITGKINLNITKDAVPKITKFSNISLKKNKPSLLNNTAINGKLADPWMVISAIHESKMGDMIIVDMRSRKDYTNVHLRETINIPFPYKDADEKKTSVFVEEIKKKGQDKEVILLPYSIFSTTGPEAQEVLSKHGVKAYLLNAGWNELYNLPNLWMPESEWENVSVIDLIDGVE